jgi:SAM-dependent methyltransferase
VNDAFVPCNICGDSRVEEIGTRDRDGRPLRSTICTTCGLVWSNPRPSEEDVRRYYSQEYRLDYKGRATPSLRHVARSARGALNRFRSLKPYLRKGSRILDVGAGGGEVVYVLRRFGFDAEGVEPDRGYAQHARDFLEVPVHAGFLQDVSFSAGSFDVVTMYHSLEHVEDPVAILSRIGSWTTGGGVLLVEVPNVEARCMSPGRRFHFAHFYSFSGPTLEAVGRRAGFEPLTTTTSSDGGNLISVFRKADRPLPAAIDAGNYARVARSIRSHSMLGYYCSPFPYRGPFSRLRAYMADRRAATRGATPRAVIDALIADETREQQRSSTRL